MTRSARLAWICRGALLVAPIALAGCGESIQYINTDGESKKISDTVETFNEYSMDPRRTTKLFATDKAPKGDEFKKYRRYTFFPTGEARVTGDDATMTVSLREERTSNDAGKMDWTFHKDGDAWKIVAAPLP